MTSDYEGIYPVIVQKDGEVHVKEQKPGIVMRAGEEIMLETLHKRLKETNENEAQALKDWQGIDGVPKLIKTEEEITDPISGLKRYKIEIEKN